MTPPLNYQPLSLTPIYHWQGARPHLLELTQDQKGTLQTLLFHREGDICLLPITSHTTTQVPDPRQPVTTTFQPITTQDTLPIMLTQLQNDGWELQGQLTFNFAGIYTQPPPPKTSTPP